MTQKPNLLHNMHCFAVFRLPCKWLLYYVWNIFYLHLQSVVNVNVTKNICLLQICKQIFSVVNQVNKKETNNLSPHVGMCVCAYTI